MRGIASVGLRSGERVGDVELLDGGQPRKPAFILVGGLYAKTGRGDREIRSDKADEILLTKAILGSGLGKSAARVRRLAPW